VVSADRGCDLRLRRGRSALGCLFLLVLLAAVAYAGIEVGGVYFRYYAFEDQLRQSAKFGDQLSDSAIMRRIQFSADSLGLPPAAHMIQIRRAGKVITISSSYSEKVDLKVWSHQIRFNPRVTKSF
jgi:hypothetical protein